MSQWETDLDVLAVTDGVRRLLEQFERLNAQNLAEGDRFQIETPSFTVYQEKYTSLQTYHRILEGDAGHKLKYTFPLPDACQSSVRQTVTLIAYRANPFLSAHPANQTVVSNSTLYLSYRDVDGQPLPKQCI